MNNPGLDDRPRLAALKTFQILDTPPEPVFDRLTRVAAAICETPIATITMVDAQRQWFKSAIGIDLTETSRAISFCTHAIHASSPYIVEDTRQHPLFRDNPLVVGTPYLRFYTGIPIITDDGFALGTLAVMDRKPRKLNDAQIETLKLLAGQIMTLIELRRQRAELDRLLAERTRMSESLRRQAMHLHEAHRIAKIASWEMELSTRHLTCITSVCQIFGMEECREQDNFTRFLNSVHPDDSQRVETAIEAAIRGDAALDIVHRVVRSDGAILYAHERGELGIGMTGQPILSGTVQNVSEQRKSQEKLQLLHTCISRLNDVVMITEAEPYDDPGPRIVFVNSAFELHTGYTRDEVLGKSPRILQGPKTSRAELDRIRNALEKKQPVSAELLNYTKSGQEIWLEMDIAPVAIATDKVSHFVAVLRDVTQRKATKEQIERLAFYDPLTRLPNRRLLMDRLSHALDMASRNENSGALLFIDLDNFKSLNDALGHDKGDLLLQQVARRLEKCIRRSNTVARLGGDEFVIILEDMSDDISEAATQAEVVTEKLLSSFNLPFHIAGYEHHCTASIGVTLFNKSENNIDELLQRADLAMYKAKASGRNAAQFFDPEMQDLVNARVMLERDLRQSLRQQDFVLHYQPQIDDNARTTGAEALLRWNHPRRGLMLPDCFIPLAEETGLILSLGQWVLEAACRQQALWSAHPVTSSLVVAVNVSARQFRHPDFVRQTLDVLHRTGANPHRIKLELTESVLVEHLSDTIGKMTELKRHGVGFSLDDFGTGYSSLAYLKQLPLDQLKIDQSFVRGVLDDSNDAAIARTILALARTLELEAIAEGVETEDQRAFLAHYGCHAYQGNLISPPLPAEEFTAALSAAG